MVIDNIKQIQDIADIPCSCERSLLEQDPGPSCVSCQAKEILDDLGQLGEGMTELYKKEEPKESRNPNCKCDCHDTYDFWRTCCKGEGRQQRREGR